MFGKTLTAMVTPFKTNGDINLEAAQDLAVWLSNNGSDGLVVAGTTGESPTLTFEETRLLFKAVKEAVDCPVIAGTGSNSTASAIMNSKMAEETGVDGLLVVSPYYNRPSQSGIAQYYEDVAASTELPVIVYDIPVRTGRGIESETMLDILSIPNVVGWKDAAGDPQRTIAEIMPHTDKLCWSGDDALNSAFLEGGAYGVISVVSHWAGVEVAEMVQAFESNLLHRVQQIDDLLEHSYGLSTPTQPNPISTKAVMRLLGHDVGYGRPPMNTNSELSSEDAMKIKELFTV